MKADANEGTITGGICARKRRDCRRRLLTIVTIVLLIVLPLMGWVVGNVSKGVEARADITSRLSGQEARVETISERLNRIELKIDRLLEK